MPILGSERCLSLVQAAFRAGAYQDMNQEVVSTILQSPCKGLPGSRECNGTLSINHVDANNFLAECGYEVFDGSIPPHELYKICLKCPLYAQTMATLTRSTLLAGAMESGAMESDIMEWLTT